MLVTWSAGICTTPIDSPVRTRTLTSMLMKKPEVALRSPRLQNGTWNGAAPAAGGAADIGQAPWVVVSTGRSAPSAVRRWSEVVTQPKIPPCAAIIRRPTSWNSGK